MAPGIDQTKVILIAILVGGITCLHYGTELSEHHRHIFYRELYFLPIILAGFWYGLRGALLASVSITALYLPFISMYWQQCSPDNFSRLMETIVYNVVAVILGKLVDRERIEQQRLRAAESLAAIGKALASVAHDMKTPLIAIGGFTRLVKKHLGPENPDHEKLNIVISETQRLEHLVRDMLDFSRPLELQPCEEDISSLTNELIAILSEFSQERNVSLEVNLAPDLPPVAYDGRRIRQAMINLVTNAIQASPPGETVKILPFSDTRNLVIDVVDRGCGIPVDQREKILHPFVTTKKEGTGLGLSIVKKIIEAHQGQLQVLENPDRGVTFRTVLPIVRS